MLFFTLDKTGVNGGIYLKIFPHYTLVSYYYHKWVDNIMEQINTEIIGNSERQWSENENPECGYR